MARVVISQSEPRIAATGAVAPVRLAGGGSKPFDQLGIYDWRDGLTGEPRFTCGIGFDQSGWTGAVLPQTAAVDFFSSDQTFASYLADLSWKGAPVTIIVGDDQTGAYEVALIGSIASHAYSGGRITFTISDLSGRLDTVALPDTFAGTGDLEGGDAATGRVKRRTWGRAFNIEGRVLDSVNNIYEFGDPARSWLAFTMVKDKGAAGGMTVVAWQGSALATLNALRAASPPTGGAAVAPSIACVKWWTQPAGPLTADVQGETGPGYVARPAQIAARIIEAYGGPSIANLAEASGWKAFEAGIHIDDPSRTVASVLDELLLPVSIAWILTATGLVTFRLLAWGNAVESILSDTVAREVSYQPLDSRKLGFQRNYRIHGDGEISATIADDGGDPTYADGTPIDVLRPAEAGANVTETRVAVAIAGQGALATKETVSLADGTVTDKLAENITYGVNGQPVSALQPQEAGSNKTEDRTAAAITGQGRGATSENLADLDPDANERLNSVTGTLTGVTQAIGFGTSAAIVVRLGTGAGRTAFASIGATSTGNSTLSIYIEARPLNEGAWTRIVTGEDVLIGPNEPGYTDCSGAVTNTTGAPAAYEVRAVASRTGTAAIAVPRQSYLSA